MLSKYFNVLTLERAIDLLEQDKLPSRGVCITFDDGYADNYEVALPILKECGVPATFFIASGFLDGGRMWNDTVIESIRGAKDGELDLQALGLGVVSVDSTVARVNAINHLLGMLKHQDPSERSEKVEGIARISGAKLPDKLMMSGAEVKALVDAGMEVGGHTVNHPILASIAVEQARREIIEGKEQLEAITGKPIRVFAYPNGKAGQDYTRVHVDLVKDLGFIGAVTTERGVATKVQDRYQMPRFTPWDRTPGRFLLRLALNRWHTKPAVVG